MPVHILKTDATDQMVCNAHPQPFLTHVRVICTLSQSCRETLLQNQVSHHTIEQKLTQCMHCRWVWHDRSQVCEKRAASCASNGEFNRAAVWQTCICLVPLYLTNEWSISNPIQSQRLNENPMDIDLLPPSTATDPGIGLTFPHDLMAILGPPRDASGRCSLQADCRVPTAVPTRYGVDCGL